MPFKHVTSRVHVVGSDTLSGSGDCIVYAVGLNDGTVMLVDAGTSNMKRILRNIEETPLKGRPVSHLVLTHAHYDHAGAACQLKAINRDVIVIAHEADVPAIEGAPGTERMTAASWYGETYLPVTVDIILIGGETTRDIGGSRVRFIHAPGHTPGSIVVLFEDDGKQVLFGQDIHGPFMADFKSDISRWRESMQKLLAIDADILCEGHFGVFSGKQEVRRFIEQHLKYNS
nr:MBL fold metallo-hydrolase [Candidatus Sigynarchaeota archaeon]